MASIHYVLHTLSSLFASILDQLWESASTISLHLAYQCNHHLHHYETYQACFVFTAAIVQLSANLNLLHINIPSLVRINRSCRFASFTSLVETVRHVALANISPGHLTGFHASGVCRTQIKGGMIT